MNRLAHRHAPAGLLRLLAVVLVITFLAVPFQARAFGTQVSTYFGLNASQQNVLRGIARDTWNFYKIDVDPHTQLPMDNITFAGGSRTPTSYGRYTSAANIGVYLWAVVAAKDLGLESPMAAETLVRNTLESVSHLQRFDGFLYQWYDTTTGKVIRNPGDTTNCATEAPTQDNCYFISAVDNGWYASGLIVVREAMPDLRSLVDSLMAPMNFGIFYDNRPENLQCNTNPAIPGNQPTGQMYGGYYAYQGPAGYHNGALYSDPRIAIYIGMGLHQMPGNVWWRTWRILPPQRCATDPDFSWTGQGPGVGYWQNYTDPQSHVVFPVWEGHYVYPPDPSLTFVPTWAGGMFEGEMANQVVPETSWGTRGFGLNDTRWAQVQMRYATQVLHYPVWGISPSSTPDDTGNYEAYGVTGLAWPYAEKKGLSQCYECSGPDQESTVTPHASFIALDALPQDAYNNIMMLRARYPGVYGVDGFFDAVNPTTGSVGHRILVLDDSMIMAAIDNAVNNRQMQRYFAADPVAWAAATYLSMETMSIH